MKTKNPINVVIAVLLALVLFNQWSQPAVVYDLNPNLQHVSLQNAPQARITYNLNNGDTATCASRFSFPRRVNGLWVVTCGNAPQPTPTQTQPAPTATGTQPPTSIATVTVAPPTATHDHGMTVTPSVGLQAWEVWHAPGAHVLPDGSMSNVHEHGHKPPQWADDFSMANFGHPVIYGGDEKSGEMEVMHKHEAYQGVYVTFNPNGCFVEMFIRYHASSTPADRSAMIHSFEIYVKDCAGNITFNQGVYFGGDPNDLAQRMCRKDEQTGSVTYDGRIAPGRDQYIIAGRCEGDTAQAEQWYVHAYNWDFSLTLINATTFFHYGEHLADPMNPATWQTTGSNELALRLEVTSLPNPLVSLPYTYPRDAWWCLQAIPTIGTRSFNGRTLAFPYWQRTNAVASPSGCPAGYLPQFNASSMPPFYGSMPGGNTYDRINFPGGDIVVVPN